MALLTSVVIVVMKSGWAAIMADLIVLQKLSLAAFVFKASRNASIGCWPLHMPCQISVTSPKMASNSLSPWASTRGRTWASTRGRAHELPCACCTDIGWFSSWEVEFVCVGSAGIGWLSSSNISIPSRGCGSQGANFGTELNDCKDIDIPTHRYA